MQTLAPLGIKLVTFHYIANKINKIDFFLDNTIDITHTYMQGYVRHKTLYQISLSRPKSLNHKS